jgi:hypothetical protein
MRCFVRRKKICTIRLRRRQSVPPKQNIDVNVDVSAGFDALQFRGDGLFDPQRDAQQGAAERIRCNLVGLVRPEP